MAEVTLRQSRSDLFFLALAAVLFFVGIGLMLFGQWSLRGLDAGEFGGALVPAGILIGLYALSIRRPRAGSAVSVGEKAALLSLAVTLIVAAYFVYKLQQLGWDASYTNQQLSRVVSTIVVILIVAGIVKEVLRRREGPGLLEDERDVDVQRRATNLAHTILLLLLGVFVLSIGFPPTRWLPMSSPAGTVHGIIIVIMLSEIVRHGRATWLYRKGGE